MQIRFCKDNKYEFHPIAPAGPVIIDVLTDGLPRGVTDRHRAVWWVAVGRWRLAGLLEGGGRMLDALIPTRFLTTLAHLLAVIMLFSSKVRSVAMRARARARIYVTGLLGALGYFSMRSLGVYATLVSVFLARAPSVPLRWRCIACSCREVTARG
jgi:hypothetical protein